VKLRRPEFRRRRKIRQRARKRRPIARVLKMIYSEPLWIADVVSDAVFTEELLRTADRLMVSGGGGRYIENTFHFEVTPPGLR
jgi:hypothetical protein